MPGPARKTHREGFSLLAVIMLLAVIAVLAGVITPMAFRHEMEARERSTRGELELIATGLQGFYADTGRLPTEGEGLAALVSDPGVGGWRGPYVAFAHEEPTAEITHDAWNRPYAYDLAPTTAPADTTEALVVSGGRDRRIGSGTVGGTWNAADPGDDLQQLVTPARLVRQMTGATAVELEDLARAAQAYFRDHAAYPTDVATLAGDYLDAGIATDALLDEWRRTYELVADNLAVPPTLALVSRGPDGLAGGGDDIVLDVNSVIPGRARTYAELATVQAIVDANAGVALSGDWTVDRAAFGLLSVLEEDGWQNPYEERMSTRTILSAGPDGDYFTPADNIPPGVVPDDVLPGGDGIEYVDGTGAASGPHCDQFAFDITNTTASPITITSLTLSWSGPTAFYSKVRIGGALLLNRSKPRVASGEEATLNAPYTLAAGATATVSVESFVSKVSKGGSKVDMGGVAITVELSDGSSFTFTPAPC